MVINDELQQAIDIFAKHGFVAHIIPEHLRMRLVIDELIISHEKEHTTIIAKSNGNRVDLSKLTVLNSINFQGEYPYANLVFRPPNKRLEPRRVKVAHKRAEKK
jgi:hypothetical protein